MRLSILVVGLLMVCEVTVEARPFRRTRQSPTVSATPREMPTQVSKESPAPKPETETKPSKIVPDALEEVNAERAARGLPPFQPDPLLTRAALTCAKIRAAHFIEEHLPNDFAHLPAGASATAAGCGALEPSWGWGTCCTYDPYTHAGAAWVMGSDGKRYMHLFVR